jgi:hypothetical protein
MSSSVRTRSADGAGPRSLTPRLLQTHVTTGRCGDRHGRMLRRCQRSRRRASVRARSRRAKSSRSRKGQPRSTVKRQPSSTLFPLARSPRTARFETGRRRWSNLLSDQWRRWREPSAPMLCSSTSEHFSIVQLRVPLFLLANHLAAAQELFHGVFVRPVVHAAEVVVDIHASRKLARLAREGTSAAGPDRVASAV